MQDKFFLPSVILEAKSFNDTIKTGNLNPFDQKDIILCSYQFAKSKDVYLKQIKWDLVVIDEAHRLRNVYKAGNKIARAIKEALASAPKILLTATPLQNSLLELYGLVSVIDDYTFGDLKSFKAMYSRVNSAADPEQFLELKGKGLREAGDDARLDDERGTVADPLVRHPFAQPHAKNGACGQDDDV